MYVTGMLGEISCYKAWEALNPTSGNRKWIVLIFAIDRYDTGFLLIRSGLLGELHNLAWKQWRLQFIKTVHTLYALNTCCYFGCTVALKWAVCVREILWDCHQRSQGYWFPLWILKYKGVVYAWAQGNWKLHLCVYIKRGQKVLPLGE